MISASVTSRGNTSCHIGVVLFSGEDRYYTSWEVPLKLWNMLVPRRNHQINARELIAMAVMVGTFAHLLEGKLLTYYGDASGVNSSFLKGANSAVYEDMNRITGRLWLTFARLHCGIHVNQVESAANVSDGPSRQRLTNVIKVGAVWVEPKVPEWLLKFWRLPVDVY